MMWKVQVGRHLTSTPGYSDTGGLQTTLPEIVLKIILAIPSIIRSFESLWFKTNIL